MPSARVAHLSESGIWVTGAQSHTRQPSRSLISNFRRSHLSQRFYQSHRVEPQIRVIASTERRLWKLERFQMRYWLGASEDNRERLNWHHIISDKTDRWNRTWNSCEYFARLWRCNKKKESIYSYPPFVYLSIQLQALTLMQNSKCSFVILKNSLLI